MKNRVHRLAAIIAILCMATFWSSTILVELLGTEEWIAKVKNAIVFPGLFILVPSIALVGATGFSLAKSRKGQLVNRKKKRMPVIGGNGLLILVPAAIYLDQMAGVGSFDIEFYVVQGLELLAGAINITLMSMNMRDGLKMAGKSK
ncbi:MAG: hypothetical protein ACN4GW_13405 [Desulforhopalus sp.]